MAEAIRPVSILPKGTALARYCMALAHEPGSALDALCEKHFRSTPQVGLAVKTAVEAGGLGTAWGGDLAPYGFNRELIDALGPVTVVDRLAPYMRRIPFHSKSPRQTSISAAGWIGETLPAVAAAEAYDTVTQQAYKVAIIVILTLEMRQFGSPIAEALVRQAIVQAITKFQDEQFLLPTVTATTARPAAITNGASEVTSTGATAAQKLTDLLAMLAVLTAAGDPFTAPFWIMRSTTAVALASTYNTAGILAFPDIRANGGTLLGIPVICSASSPAQITLLDASQLLLSDDGNASIERSTNASVQMDTAPSSGAQASTSVWQAGLFALKVQREIAWQRAQAGSVAWMSVAY